MTTDTGLLMIADITGYSGYLNDSELEHARDSLNSLLNLLIEETREPFQIAKLEGDAVFSFTDGLPFENGQTLVEMIEAGYFSFRQSRDLMVINTTCTCRACANLPHLDLKFFVHQGDYAFQDLGEYKEMLGVDVNVVHRMTKNDIKEQHGLTAYAAFSEPVWHQYDLSAHLPEAIMHHEVLEDVGDLNIYAHDLSSAWEQRRSANIPRVNAEDAIAMIDTVISADQGRMWDFLTSPEHRNVLIGSDSQRLENPEDRRGTGSIYYCAHGEQIIEQRVVGWDPPTEYTDDTELPIPGTHGHTTYRLDPVADGTRLTLFIGPVLGPPIIRQIFTWVLGQIITPSYQERLEKFKEYVEDRVPDSGP